MLMVHVHDEEVLLLTTFSVNLYIWSEKKRWPMKKKKKKKKKDYFSCLHSVQSDFDNS